MNMNTERTPPHTKTIEYTDAGWRALTLAALIDDAATVAIEGQYDHVCIEAPDLAPWRLLLTIEAEPPSGARIVLQLSDRRANFEIVGALRRDDPIYVRNREQPELPPWVRVDVI
jgi:hypothetical protein